METAQTWQSYEIALKKVLSLLNPVHCFEWGAGESTLMLARHLSVESVDSVESDAQWVDNMNAKLTPNDNVMMIFEPDLSKYKFVRGRKDKYDLVFIDGKDRENCLIEAHYIINPEGVVILHDAERERYRCSIDSYKYKIWEDDGHTVILTNNKDVYEKISKNSGSPA